MTIGIITLLLTSGLIVGFTNTLAGGASVISLSIFMFLGLPPVVANGTNRIPVILQTLTSSFYYFKQGIVDLKKIIYLGIVTAIGSFVGAIWTVNVPDENFQSVIMFVLIGIFIFLALKPDVWKSANTKILAKKTKWYIYPIFFLIGVYGGFIYIGMGYLFLAVLVSLMGYDLVSANAIKNILGLFFTPIALLVFIVNNNVNYEYGLIHAVGNIAGAYIASVVSVKKGEGFIRYFIMIILIIFIAHYAGWIDLKQLFRFVENI